MMPKMNLRAKLLLFSRRQPTGSIGLPHGLEVGAQVEKRGHDHVSGGYSAEMSEEVGHEAIVLFW